MDDDGRDLLMALRSLPEENQPAREAVLEIVDVTSMAATCATKSRVEYA